MEPPGIPLMLGFLGPIILGCAILLALRVLSDGRPRHDDDLLYLLLHVVGWTLIVIGLLTVFTMFCAGVPGLIALIVLAMVWQRRGTARRHALLSAMTVAAERMVPLGPVIEAFAAEGRGYLARRARELAARLEAGWTLPDAVDASAGFFPLFPPKVRAAIRIGYESGALAPALRDVIDEDESHSTLWAHAAGKLVYLMFLISFTATILSFVMLRITPAFQKIFDDFGVQLPPVTRFVISLSNFFANFWFLSAPLGMLLVFLTIYCLLRFIGWIHWDLPGMARLMRRYHTAAILESLALTAQRNRPFPEAVAVIARSYPQTAIRARLLRVLLDLEGGADWCESLARQRLINRADLALLQAATRVGNLSWALREMADSSRRRLAYRLQNWLQVLFALVIVAYGFLVGMFVVSHFMPLITLIQNLT